jgi:hypothetical protein
MIVRLKSGRRRGAADEGGFSLVELLVTITAGLVVAGTLFTILDITVRQTSRVYGRIDASQQARTALAKIENELHSSCIGNNEAPIIGGSGNSSDTKLVFLAAYGDSPAPTPVKHEITFDSVNRTLTDTTYPAVSGPPWQFGTGTSEVLLRNVHQSTSPNVPVFQYFRYEVPTSGGQPYRDPAGNAYYMLLDGETALPSGARLNNIPVASGTIPTKHALTATPNLSSSDAVNTVALVVTLRVGPERTQEISDIRTTVTDRFSLRLTPVANHAGGNPDIAPCG